MTIDNQKAVAFTVPCVYLRKEETAEGTILHFSDGDLFLKKGFGRRFKLERRLKEAHTKHCKKFRIVIQFDLHQENTNGKKKRCDDKQST